MRRAIPAEAVESRWAAADGHPIRRIDWPTPQPSPRGSILFLPGRGDFYEKYLETLDHWHRAGWQVTALDWRGQAGSGRLGLDPMTGHVDDFAIWTGRSRGVLGRMERSRRRGRMWRLAIRWAAIWCCAPWPRAGSMPAAAVLSAPMLGFAASVLPQAVMHQAAKVDRRAGRPAATGVEMEREARRVCRCADRSC